MCVRDKYKLKKGALLTFYKTWISVISSNKKVDIDIHPMNTLNRFWLGTIQVLNLPPLLNSLAVIFKCPARFMTANQPHRTSLETGPTRSGAQLIKHVAHRGPIHRTEDTDSLI